MGARFSTPVQTGPGAHPASCTMGAGSLPRVKRPGRGADHPLPPKRRGHKRVELYLYSPSGPSWPVIGRTLPFIFYLYKDNIRFIKPNPEALTSIGKNCFNIEIGKENLNYRRQHDRLCVLCVISLMHILQKTKKFFN